MPKKSYRQSRRRSRNPTLPELEQASVSGGAKLDHRAAV
jgi:hypothetical protein